MDRSGYTEKRGIGYIMFAPVTYERRRGRAYRVLYEGGWHLLGGDVGMSEVYDPRMGYSTPRSQRSSGEVSLLLLEDSGLEGEGDNCWHRAVVLCLHRGGLKVGSELRA